MYDSIKYNRSAEVRIVTNAIIIIFAFPLSMLYYCYNRGRPWYDCDSLVYYYSASNEIVGGGGKKNRKNHKKNRRQSAVVEVAAVSRDREAPQSYNNYYYTIRK